MKSTKSNLIPKILISLSVTHLLLFTIYYLSNYVLEFRFCYYVSDFLIEFAESALPLTVAVFALVAYSKRRFSYGFAALYILIFTLPCLIYALPYNYLDFFYAELNTPDAILLSLLYSLLKVAVSFAEGLLLFLLMIFVLKKLAKAPIKNQNDLFSLLSAERYFNFDVPINAAVFSAALARFIYNLGFEIYDTVLYLIKFSSSIRPEEIIYMVVSYIFILATLVLSHMIALTVKDIFVKGN